MRLWVLSFYTNFYFTTLQLHVCTQLPVEILYITCNVDILELLKCFQMKVDHKNGSVDILRFTLS